MPLKKIKLPSGQSAIVDAEDFEILEQYKWYFSVGYARRTAKDGSRVLMHRQILNAPDNMEVDHKNGNRLDNRKTNIRVVTKSQNQWNRGKSRNNTSGYKGVSYHKLARKYLVGVKLNYKQYYGGSFYTVEEAAKAAQTLYSKLHGEFARVE